MVNMLKERNIAINILNLKKDKKLDLSFEILREKSWKLKIVLKSKTQVVYKLGRLLKRTKGFKLE
jgi:hypothetical protein